MSISIAEIFDALVEDQAVNQQYASFVLNYAKEGDCLDLACGTGSISRLLKSTFKMTGLDIDPHMLQQYAIKNPDCQTILGSMSDLSSLGAYDVIFLFGDSMNYILDFEEVKTVIQQVLHHLKPGGVFLFDIHTENRYEEFKEEYCEEGLVMNHPFQWTILSLPDQIINHHFAFYDALGHAETISFNQKVYPLNEILLYLESMNLQVDVYSDFILGIHPDKEKYHLAVRRSSV